DGKLIYHASIGRVFVPFTASWLDWLKGKRYFQIVDAQSYKVLKRVDMGEKLKAFGRPWIDSADRQAPDAVAQICGPPCRSPLDRNWRPDPAVQPRRMRKLLPPRRLCTLSLNRL